MKEFEENFPTEMDNKIPKLLADFRKGNQHEEGLTKMVEMAKGLMGSYKRIREI